MFSKKQVYISYHYNKDRQYKNLLLAWNKNNQFEFKIHDRSADVSINSDNASTIKRVISRKINEGTCFIVIVGELTRKCEWVKWEIEKARELEKKIVAIKTHRENLTPTELYKAGAIWAYSFRLQSINTAFEKI
jgi:hypothetical protein